MFQNCSLSSSTPLSHAAVMPDAEMYAFEMIHNIFFIFYFLAKLIVVCPPVRFGAFSDNLVSHTFVSGAPPLVEYGLLSGAALSSLTQLGRQ